MDDTPARAVYRRYGDVGASRLRRSWPPRPKPGRSRHAFTLVEVLVVIAILSLLIAMLQPTLQQARQRGQAAVCHSNLRQISVASTVYCDQTGYMPNGYHGPDVVWVPEIFPYAPDPLLYWCPSSDPKAKWAGLRYGSGEPAHLGYERDQVRLKVWEYFSYGHNNGGSIDGHKPSLGVGDYVNAGWNRWDRVVQPAAFIMYGDSTPDGLWDHFIDEDYESGDGRTEYPADRHDHGAHIAFGDNHVRHIPIEHLTHRTAGGTILPERRRMWNNDFQPH